MNKVTTSTLIIFVLIAGWVFYLTNIKKDDLLTVRYYSISELASESNDIQKIKVGGYIKPCLLYTSPSPRDRTRSRMPSSA